MTAHSSTKHAPRRKRSRRTAAPRLLLSSRRPRTSSSTRRPPHADPALAHWLGTFHRYHTDGATLIPLALRIVIVKTSTGSSSSPLLPPGRYAVEVAENCSAERARWTLIIWEIDVPGMRFLDCGSLQEAMTLYERPDVTTIPTAGVRLRPNARPW